MLEGKQMMENSQEFQYDCWSKPGKPITNKKQVNCEQTLNISVK